MHPPLRPVQFMHLAKQTKLILKYHTEWTQMTKPLLAANITGCLITAATVIAWGIKRSQRVYCHMTGEMSE